MKSTKGHVVVVDDDREMRGLIQDFLTKDGYRVTCFPSALHALKALRPSGELAPGEGQDVDVIVSDLQMAHMDGMQFLKTIQAERPEIPVVLVTAFGSIDTAIEAMKNGAYHYVVKPFKLAEMSITVEHALERRHLSRDNQILRQEVKKGWAMSNLLGKSPAMQAVFDLVSRVAGSTANVLINGESGTGKEMVARAIHSSGPRATKPFIAINCTAIPETLLESELFGHAKGSFTGATSRKKGLIEEANEGTLFLDEIGDMSPPLQAKLLRVLQERKIRPVGDNNFYDVDVRVVAATHKDLKAAIREGRFREDLFYRLSVIPIVIPPLRDRTEDIPLLAEHFLQKYAAANGGAGGKRITGFTKAALAKLVSLRWEGNVRELENVVERAVVLCPQTIIDVSDIPNSESGGPDEFLRTVMSDFPTVAQLEERYIRMVLQKTAGRKDKASQILGINRRTLYRKERDYGWVAEDAELEGVGD
jgi:two-component system, NtrC family, response regulator HydG